MPIRVVEHYTREDLRREPDALFAFGENLIGRGLRGQAAAARGEPNAVGIVTKRYPRLTPGAFLTDEDLDEVKPLLDEAFGRLRAHLEAGGVVVLPAAGFGTGLAQLSQHAPRIMQYIEEQVAMLHSVQRSTAKSVEIGPSEADEDGRDGVS